MISMYMVVSVNKVTPMYNPEILPLILGDPHVNHGIV